MAPYVAATAAAALSSPGGAAAAAVVAWWPGLGGHSWDGKADDSLMGVMETAEVAEHFLASTSSCCSPSPRRIFLLRALVSGPPSAEAADKVRTAAPRYSNGLQSCRRGGEDGCCCGSSGVMETGGGELWVVVVAGLGGGEDGGGGGVHGSTR